MKRTPLLLSLFSALLLFSLTAQAQKTPRLKTLVFEADVKKAKKGFAISVVRHIPNPDGTEQRQVLPLSKATRIFYNSGDKITFELRSNFDGYVYVLHRDAKNRFFVLYPRQEKANQQNKITGCKLGDYTKCKPFSFPQGGKFAFRPPKGLEQVAFVITSKQLLTKEIKQQASNYGFVAQNQEDRKEIAQSVESDNSSASANASQPAPAEQAAPHVAPNPYAQVLCNSKGLYKRKTLVFEADAQADGEADFVLLPKQNLEPQEASLMFIRFFLAHR